ncbi:MAG: hypothetical protein ACE5EW_05665 [Thermoplasmata archaeon]
MSYGGAGLIPSGTPRRFGLLQGLILVHTARVVGLSFLVGLNQGLFEASFAIPAAFGDFLIALTAPFVVLALRRGALVSWGAAIAWNALGLADFAVAITVGAILAPPAIFTLPWVLIPTVGVPIFAALHVAALALLLRRPMRAYFAQRDLEATV